MFSWWRSFTSLVKFATGIQNYFLLEVVVSGIVTPPPICLLLLVYKKIIDCYITLYPDTLLKVFIYSRSFLVEFSGSLIYFIYINIIMLSKNIDIPFICFPFLSLHCLITSDKSSRLTLNKSREIGHHCLITSFSTIIIMLHRFQCIVFSFPFCINNF